ncbi:ABC transporter B family member 19-like [Cucumis melo var. makuwa]|uniref:ABC transporter B family member 19-like n=1 Tax=Cucumis melo var. makuwa TaxID=1194695 RepID=A0A5D3DV13_CUCMM|nr:ABC transporter B family member 19-like [Cucumis melo var. makuwa]TYK27140.1 ABC transporter B family member 19-like [Cucumis melo var. makuwa]
MKGVLRFEKKGKLSPRFVGPFEILERIGPVAYRLALSPAFFAGHDVFHVSMLRKYVADRTHVVDFKPLQINENLSYEEQHVEILAREVKMQCNRGIAVALGTLTIFFIENKKREKETLNFFSNPSCRRLAPPSHRRRSPPSAIFVYNRSSAPFRRSPLQGKSLAVVFSRADSSSRQRLVAIHHQSSSTASFCRRPSEIAATRATPHIVGRPSTSFLRTELDPRLHSSLRQPPACSLAFTRDQLVTTGSQVARVRERASSGVPLFRTLIGSKGRGKSKDKLAND